ncbi:unnamed protein product [Polarella glacialis]|uniref:Pentatricopeptide repeat-containing protein n=1 Tax=Polarella glacialis TaxID=89957 RepID=A0A813G2X4_POLGL|nr:unnamed protein product [Polarella glacialis]
MAMSLSQRFTEVAIPAPCSCLSCSCRGRGVSWMSASYSPPVFVRPPGTARKASYKDQTRAGGSAIVHPPLEGFSSAAHFVEWLRNLQGRKTLLGEEIFMSGVSACGKGPEWQRALNLLDAMQQSNLEPRAAAHTVAIIAVGSQSVGKSPSPSPSPSWGVALLLLDRMLLCRIRPYDGTGSGLITAFSSSANWQLAVHQLTEMRVTGLLRLMRSHAAAAAATEAALGDWAQVLTYLSKATELAPQDAFSDARAFAAQALPTTSRSGSRTDRSASRRFVALPGTVALESTAICAVARASNWELALFLLWQAQVSEVKLGTATYNAAMQALRQAERWEFLLDLLDEMWQLDVKPDVHSYSAAADACNQAGQWRWVVQLYEESQLYGFTPPESLLAAAAVALRMCGLDARAEQLSLQREASRKNPSPAALSIPLIGQKSGGPQN